MSLRALAIGRPATLVLALVAYAAFEAGIERGRTKASGIVVPQCGARLPSAAASSPCSSRDVDRSAGKRVLYWHIRWCRGRS